MEKDVKLSIKERLVLFKEAKSKSSVPKNPTSSTPSSSTSIVKEKNGVLLHVSKPLNLPNKQTIGGKPGSVPSSSTQGCPSRRSKINPNSSTLVEMSHQLKSKATPSDAFAKSLEKHTPFIKNRSQQSLPSSKPFPKNDQLPMAKGSSSTPPEPKNCWPPHSGQVDTQALDGDVEHVSSEIISEKENVLILQGQVIQHMYRAFDMQATHGAEMAKLRSQIVQKEAEYNQLKDDIDESKTIIDHAHLLHQGEEILNNLCLLERSSEALITEHENIERLLYSVRLSLEACGHWPG